MISLTLPWPAKELSPNARVHWSVRARKVKAARKSAGLLVMAGRDFREWGRMYARVGLSVSYTFHPCDRRRRDLDNAIASCKAYGDGIAEAMGVDDSTFKLAYQFGEIRKPACVEVTIA